MSAEETRRFIDEWDKHVEKTEVKRKQASFSSVAEAIFCETFRKGILAHEYLTEKERLAICKYAKL